jgi:hypothetical protein
MIAMAYIHLYDGATQISEGTGLTPVVFGQLNASDNEVSAPKALTIKTEAGYTTYGNVTISFEGATASKFSVCDTVNGVYGSTLTITNPITEAGTTIYVKAQATSDESPVNDVSTDIKIQATIAVV